MVMKDTANDVHEPIEDEDVVDQEGVEEAEPTEAELESATVPPEPPVAEVESIQDLLVKQEAQAEEEEEDDEPLLTMAAEERVDALDTRVVPIQAGEFICKKCYLVKHRSQLADKKKMLCRDCA